VNKTTLLRGAGLGALLAFGLGAAAHAADADKKPAAHHKKHHAVDRGGEAPTAAEFAAMKTEMAALEQRLNASNAAAQQAQAAAAAAAQAQASAQAAQSAAQAEQTAISQIPADVEGAVAKLPKPHTDGLYFKGVKITPGGFIEAAGVYRTRGTQSDGASSPGFGSLPYAGTSTEAAHMGETRFSARQSRLSLLAEGDATPDVHLSAYYEMDFLGAGQTANSNESNSYNLRIRNLYTTADFKNYGLSVLAGQSWSLVTLNDKGITPRNEMIPLNIDAQYNVGFVWARQPGIRVTENFGHGLWAAVAAEMPQTNSYGGAAALQPGTYVTYNSAPYAGGSLYNSLNAYSFNNVPDLIAKVAYDNTVVGHHLHAEAYGLYRNFYDRVGAGCTAAGVNSPAINTAATANTCKVYRNTNTSGGGIGVGLVGEVIPGLLDLRVSDLNGRGLGRYGSAQLNDAYIASDGALDGIRENLLLAGLTFHATKTLDVYGYFGMEQDSHASYAVGTTQGGYGNPYFSNSGGCEVAGAFNCTGNTRSVTEATLGLWDKAYTGDFGSFRLGLQYSYFRRDSFDGLVDNSTASKPIFGAVNGNDQMIYTSIRYYPFQK